MSDEATTKRKDEHLDVVLDQAVGSDRRTGLAGYRLEYDALPEVDLEAVDLSVQLLGRQLRAPLLVGAMTGGTDRARTYNRRLARAKCVVPSESLQTDGFSGDEVVDRILEAHAFALATPYRAATHNKGIMNGVDAVVVATGNDWRAVEAGAHSFAVREGRYTSLSQWEKNGEADLVGTLEMPMAVGTVGGATRVHPTAKAALKILGVESAGELAEVIVAVGLAQNLAALRALASEGIQRGHMALHARQVAIAAGAVGSEVDVLAQRMVQERSIRIDRASDLLEDLR